jgi:phospholipase C
MRDRINSAQSPPLAKRLNWKQILNCVSLLAVMLSVQGCGGGGSGQTSSPDFKLGLSSGSVSVTPGSTSHPVTLSATGLNGFQDSVSVAVSGLPNGVTVSPVSPFNISAGGNQAITFTVSSSAAPGSATITFQGTSGSLAHSASLTLQIVTSANFNLTISPSSILVSPGTSSSPLTVSVSPLNGFSGTVSVTIQGLPTGVSTSPPTPFSVNAGGSQQLTITVAGSVPKGSYPVVLTGVSGNLTNTANLALTIGSVTFSQKFQHVVVIFQENRTPDNLFHGLPNADIANTGQNSSGKVITLSPIPLANDYDLSHAHKAFVDMFDNGKMDGADKIPIVCKKGATNCPPPNPQFMYVMPSDVQPYFQLAEAYTFGDRMFQTNEGPSFPAHQFIIAGTSAPTATSDLFAAENPSGADTGCTAPPDATVLLIDPLGNENQSTYPCFEHLTLMDSLDTQKLTWNYYAPLPGSIWTGPNAIQHLRSGPDWAKVIIPQTQVLTDIANGQLAQVSWVIPDGADSDHASSNDGTGPSWVASIVNAIGTSQYWGNTAVIITWDDWGGWYDHVPPTIYNSYEYGFRVPLIIVSPYSRQGYVSHVTHDFGSILKFTEEVFNLPSLGYADSRADDFSDCFDLTQTPIPFQVVPAKVDQNFFLTVKRPGKPPDDDGDEK